MNTANAANKNTNPNPTPAPTLNSNQIIPDQNPQHRRQSSTVNLNHPIDPSDDPQRLLPNHIDGRLTNLPPTPRDVQLGQSGPLSSNLDFLADISAHQPRTEADINPMMIDDQQPYFGWNDVTALNPDQHQHSRPVQYETMPSEMLQLWLEPRADTISHHSSLDLMRDATLGLIGDNFISSERRSSRMLELMKSGDNIPNERFARVERCWLAPPNYVGRLMNSLWRDVSCCDSDNLFSFSIFHSMNPQQDNCPGTRFGLDEECRLQLQAAFGLTQSSLATLNSPGNDALSPAASTTGSGSIPTFPPAEILDMALDLYFRNYHPLVPFVHMPTFCAKRTRLPMLFVMCLIGMIILGTKGTTSFVSKTFGVSLTSCFNTWIH
jgi:hypothetical protein